MSFTGDLEHLPIVDLIQLLNSTRKSGILRVTGRKGESRLVFKDGYIVSASHLNNSVRIGKILVDMGLLTQDDLDRALREQELSGRERKPLIVTLVDKGSVREEDAYRGLEALIEMTVVEILTWKKGVFVLEVLQNRTYEDGYRYYPERFNREINVDTQGILMDALRVFDEKVRDGELAEETGDEEPAVSEELVLSADILGLEGIEQRDRKLSCNPVDPVKPDPAAVLRKRIGELSPGMAGSAVDSLARFAGGLDPSAGTMDQFAGPGAILVSRDPLLAYFLGLICAEQGTGLAIAGDRGDFDRLAESAACRGSASLVLIDSFDCEDYRHYLQGVAACPATVCFVPENRSEIVWEVCRLGAQTVLPRPVPAADGDAADDFIRFLESCRAVLRNHRKPGRSDGSLALLAAEMDGIADPPTMALLLLRSVAEFMPRAITLVVGRDGLRAEKGIGIGGVSGEVTAAPSTLRIPLAEGTPLRRIVADGRTWWGSGADCLPMDQLNAAIGQPRRSPVLLLPMRSQGRTVSLTYGDFGTEEVRPVPTTVLELLARQASLRLDYSYCRKKLAEFSPSGS